MIKRVSAVLICLCLLISMAQGSFAETEDFAEDEYWGEEEFVEEREFVAPTGDIDGAKTPAAPVDGIDGAKEAVNMQSQYDEAADFLKAVGVMPSAIGNRLEAAVSRASFVLFAANMLKMESGDTETVFADVPATHIAADAIGTFYQLGYIGRQENFRPEDDISLTEAVKILVACIGHSVFAENKGGYPLGYLQTARELNIISRQSAAGGGSGSISGFQASQLIFNAMQADFLSQTGYGETQTYSKEKGVSILTKYFDIYFIDGIIQSNGITALASSETPKKTLSAGGIEIEIGEKDVRGLLGLAARVFYTKTDSANLLLSAHVSGKNDVVGFFGKDREASYAAGDNIIAYTEKGVWRKFKLDKSFKLIYNGKAEGDYETFLADIEKARVKLIDNNKDGRYDVVMVDKFTDMIVSTVDQADGAICDMRGVASLYLFDDYDMVYISDKAGEPIGLSRIQKRDVLSFAASNDGRYIEIVVCSESAAGTLKEKDSDGVHTIENDETGAAVRCYSSVADLEIGDKGTFYLNAWGYIVDFVKTVSGEKVFGLLLAAQPPKSIGKAVEVRMLTAHDEIKVFKTASKVEIDGEIKKDTESIYKAIEDKCKQNNMPSYEEPDVVIYSLNQDGLIKYLDFAQTVAPLFNEGAEDGDLYVYKNNEGEAAAKATYLYKSALGTFANRFLVDANTVVFGVDFNMAASGAQDSEIYYATGKNMFENDVAYGVAAYTVQKDPYFADAVLYHGARKRATSAPTVIYEINRSMDNEGNSAYRAYGISPGGDVELVISEEAMRATPVGAGDLILYTINGAGVVYDIVPYYNHKTKTMLVNQSGAAFNGKNRTYMMYPFSVFDQSVKFVLEPSSLSDSLTENTLLQSLVTTKNIYQVTQKDGRVNLKPVTLDGIVSYKNNPGEYSRVIVYTSNGSVRLLLIYND